MTKLECWDDELTMARHYRLDGALLATVTERDLRDAPSAVEAARSKVWPLVWLAMPGHEGPV